MESNVHSIYNFHPENYKTISDLVNCIQDNDFEVTPFIGAGMSYPIYPLWGDVLQQICQKHNISIVNVKKIDRLIRKFNYEEAATIIYDSLKGIRYIEALNDQFGEQLIKTDNLAIMPIRLLPSLFSKTIITTNFDRILNHVYSCDTQITMQSSGELRAISTRGKERLRIIKLHGDIKEKKLVLTKKEYGECYGDKFDSPNVLYLQTLFQSKIMLFLGCSLKNDRTFQLLKITTLQGGFYPHFALLEAVDDLKSDAFIQREQELSSSYIRCIWYPKGKYEFVESFLLHLINECNYRESLSHAEYGIQRQEIKAETDKTKISEMLHKDQRKLLLQSSMLSGLSDNPKMHDILPESYIDPKVKTSFSNADRFMNFIQENTRGSIALLSSPGMGKSTTFKAILINKYYENIHGVIFYYLEANDLLKRINDLPSEDIILDVILQEYPRNSAISNMHLVLLIDSCDELSPSNRSKFISVIKDIKSKTQINRNIWIACRLDYYSRYYRNILTKFLDHEIHLCDWSRRDADKFIESALKKSNLSNEYGNIIKNKIKLMTDKNPVALSFLENPFKLTLLLYCVLNQNDNNNIMINNAYELYELFYIKWFQQHNINDEMQQKRIRELHTHIALYFYNKKGVTIKLNEIFSCDNLPDICHKRVFLDLLRLKMILNSNSEKISNVKIDRFWHESFAEYLIASDLVSFLKNPPLETIIRKENTHLCNIVNYDVNIFIKEAFNSISPSESVTICEKLAFMYTYLQADKQLYIKERWNLLYYVGRVTAKNVTDRNIILKLQREVLFKAFDYENDPRIRRTVAISLMSIYDKDNIETEEKIMTYLNQLELGTEADIINRSIQVIYCGDVGFDEKSGLFIEFGDLNNFVDDNKISWNRVKKYTLDRLQKNDRTSLLYRLWDLRTLRLFFESRNWQGITEDEYRIICALNVEELIYSSNLKKMLLHEKSLFQDKIIKNLNNKIFNIKN